MWGKNSNSPKNYHFSGYEFELRKDSNVGQLREAIGEEDGSDAESILLFYHSAKIRDLMINMEQKPSDLSVFETEGRIIEVSNSTPLIDVFGDVDVIKADFDTEAFANIRVQCNGKSQKFLQKLAIEEDSTIIEVTANNIDLITCPSMRFTAVST